MNDREQTGAMPTEGGSSKKPAGPFVGIIIIVLVLVLGGLYFWSKQVPQEVPSAETILNAPDEILNSLEVLGTSDEFDVIESDLNATELENLDAEVQDIESELNNL